MYLLKVNSYSNNMVELNSDIFVDYLKQIHKKFGKCIIFVDRATPHCSKITRKFLAENKDSIKLEYFPVGSTENFNCSRRMMKTRKI